MRKRKPVEDPLGEEVAYSFIATTAEKRSDVVRHWDGGDPTWHEQYADSIGIDGDGLLVASLLEAEHPSVCLPTGKPRRKNYGQLLKLAKAYRAVDKSAKSVDNSGIPVDKSAENVDKPRKSVERRVDKKYHLSTETGFSTGCGEIHPQSVTYAQSYPQADVDNLGVTFSLSLAGSGELSTVSTPPTATTN